LVLGYVGLSTIHNRADREMYPSLWFIILGFLWFAWILSTAVVALGAEPVRGVAQVAVQSWYSTNLQLVVLGLFGLGALFYFVPKLAGKNLYSKHLAFLALLSLTFCGSWTGQSSSAPLPAWIGAVSNVAALLTLVTALAVFENLRTTCCIKAPEAEAKFFSFSTPFFFVALLLGALAVIPSIDQRVSLTLYHAGQTEALVVGFFGLVALGGIYHVLPKVADIQWPFAGLVRAHLWAATFGALIVTAAYVIGGWQQGGQLLQAGVKSTDIAKSVLMPIRMASLGETLWALGALLLFGNVALLIVKRAKACMKCCETGCCGAEVKS
jgi:cytochrome c oxidase cbb3-type subunit 1